MSFEPNRNISLDSATLFRYITGTLTNCDSRRAGGEARVGGERAGCVGFSAPGPFPFGVRKSGNRPGQIVGLMSGGGSVGSSGVIYIEA